MRTKKTREISLYTFLYASVTLIETFKFRFCAFICNGSEEMEKGKQRLLYLSAPFPFYKQGIQLFFLSSIILFINLNKHSAMLSSLSILGKFQVKLISFYTNFDSIHCRSVPHELYGDFIEDLQEKYEDTKKGISQIQKVTHLIHFSRITKGDEASV